MQRATLLLSVVLSSSSLWAAELSVVSFGGVTQKAQEQAYYRPYTQQSGTKISALGYNGEVERLRAAAGTSPSAWDVVEVGTSELLRGCSEGLFEKLDWSKVGDKSRFIDIAVNDCGMGLFVWSTVLAYNARALNGKVPRSWADMWDVAKFPGKRGMRKSAKYSLEIALLADGVRMDDVYRVLSTEDGINRAFKKLDQLRPHALWWEEGDQPLQWINSGEVAMSVAYSGRVANAQREGKVVNQVWDESIYDVHHWVIMKNSADKSAAYKLLQTANQATNQVEFAKAISYGPVVKDAIPLLPPAVAHDLPTSLDNLMVAMPIDNRFWVERGAALESRFQAWLAAK